MDLPEPVPYQTDETILEGDIAGSPNEKGKADYHTLDEPVKETILRDLKAVGTKFLHVLYPKEKKTLLKDWDLWGPLILCVFLSAALQKGHLDNVDDGGLQFAEIFFMVWVGAVVVTVNSKLLGGNISFFQSVCVLGYCLLVPCIALLLCLLLDAIFSSSVALFIMKTVFTISSLIWSIFGATAFLADSTPPKRKGLAVYPIGLFYFAVNTLIQFRMVGY